MINLEAYDRTVAIGVDMENDFVPPGALGVEGGEEAIPNFNEVARKIRCAEGIVALTRDWHPPQTTHFEQWPPHCVAGTWGAEFHPTLRVLPQDIIISKGMGDDEDAFSGFEGVSSEGLTLEQIVTPKNIDERILVAIGGIATDFCVKATTLDGCKIASKFTGQIDIVVIEDAIAAVNLKAGDDQRAIEEMTAAGAVFINSADIVSHKATELEG